MTRVEKPWGYELHWEKTDRYVGKLIHVNAGHALRLATAAEIEQYLFDALAASAIQRSPSS